MSPFRLLPFRRPPSSTSLSISTTLCGITCQRRWAQVHDVRFVAFRSSSQQSVIEKYRDKLSRKAAEEGHGSVDQLREAYKEKIDEAKRREKVEGLDKALAGKPPSPPSVEGTPPGVRGKVEEIGAQEEDAEQPAEGRTKTATREKRTPQKQARGDAKIKSLPQILDMNKIRGLPVPEISAIWRLRHTANPQSLSAVIPAPTYSAMEALARRCPQFVLPVPRAVTPPETPEGADEAQRQQQQQQQQQPGAEIHFLQWTFDPPTQTSTVLFTHLAEFKMRGEFAVPHTTITHHLDLAGGKGVVLMQGQVMDGKGISAADARWLVMCLQRFYGGWGLGLGAGGDKGQLDAERLERARQRRLLLEGFARGGEGFSLDKLLEEAERMG
ncbi:putative F1F0 ATP synthase assembly protein Atp11 [Zalerion maritima]|uniref:F1F0 ATP synthase assembly protein Atp11 n=1 Tax=Zalerion maritima TaxID=339359 RepID=A0AAD5RPJ5_9PEZI|nr:putative F1F0 ATP synthase assembly protein Atp11 [Zalerion maritima]